MANTNPTNSDLAYADTLWRSANIAGIGKHGFVLTPGRYVGAEEQEEDSEPFTQKYPRLLAELEAHFSEGERLTAVVREQLGRVNHGG